MHRKLTDKFFDATNLISNLSNQCAHIGTCTNDISSACCYCAFPGLVPSRSQKLGLSYLKPEARRACHYALCSHGGVSKGIWGGSSRI
jgi:hypothetical protein